MDLSALPHPPALTPLDGRYQAAVLPLVDCLSEAALNRARMVVEIEWLITLSQSQALPGVPALSDEECAYLRAIPTDFGAEEIAELAAIEAETRHDVKAVEYFLKRRLLAAPTALHSDSVLPHMTEIVHIFCTSEDINNLAYALIIRDAVRRIWLPKAHALTAQIAQMARELKDQPMLSRTHGQPATPTTLGKELAVTAYRLSRQLRRVAQTKYLGKMNGATGTYGAHAIAVPDTNWPKIACEFVTSLGLTFTPLTTQIEAHDWQAELYADIARFNRIAHNFATDVWQYISLGYFKQNLAAQGSTGSSTMPHKVNPIRFENAEANLEISNALLDTLAATLVTSRLQRDLTDSTTQRNVGPALGHSLLALDNISRGLAGLDVDTTRLDADLEDAWEVLGEAVQQAMRAAAIAGASGMEDPYERLKELTRGHRVSGEQMREFITSLRLPEAVEARLVELTPQTYLGLAPQLVDELQVPSPSDLGISDSSQRAHQL